ncbi:ribonuclease H-like domain-containing protein [Tanacetum coccineum]|uniref:Ribonuclease H-like domain-containing protein n=1 Tax=Tanacetum coccineum TaxID=301880 RepID=A0ABQ4Z0J9_9ASTR
MLGNSPVFIGQAGGAGSLPSEWSMHVVVWRNKSDLESISFDDLYNNFKIVKQEVKRSVISSSNSSSQNVAFVSTSSSTNDINTSNVYVSTASSSLSIASSTDNTARLSDATIYAFLANQPNGSQVVHEDLEQIHEDDLEEMDLKCDTAGYDKTKVECFNCHKMRHFARECKNPRSQENRSRNQDSSMRIVNVEESSSKAILTINAVGFDWSFMIEEEIPTNFALMAFSDSELNKSKSNLAKYKRGLASVEEQLVFYKKNEERLKKEKESNQIKINNFENASESLDKLIGCQISDNHRKGVGYNAVAPPPTGLFTPSTIDFSNSGLEEFKQPEFEGYRVKVNKNVSENSSHENMRNTGAPIIEDWVSDCDEDECEEMISDNVQHKSEPKPEQAKQPRKINENPRNSRTNWNENKTQKLGVGFQCTKKACFVNFAPTAVLTKSGLVPISTARQSSSRAATSVSTVRPIKTTAPKSFVESRLGLKVLVVYYTTNGHQSTMSNRQERIGYSRANDNCVKHLGKSKEVETLRYLSLVVPLKKVGDEAVHKELGDRMEMAVTTASSFNTEQDSDAQTRTKFSVKSQHTPTASSSSTSQPTTSQPTSSQATSSQAPSFYEPTTEPITATSSPHPQETQIHKNMSMPNVHLLGGLTPGSVEGSMQLKELMNLCTKLVARVKWLEDKLKSTNKRKKAKMVISDEEEVLVSDDPFKQGRMEEAEDADVEKDAAKILTETSKERVKTYNRRRSTDSLQVSTAAGLFSTAEDIQDTNEELAKKVQEEEQTKNMANYKMKYFKGMSYDQIRPIFEEEYRKVQTLFKKDSKVTFSSRKITEEPKELSEEDLKKMLEIVPVEEVGNITEAYQGFEDMLKEFDREDLDTLWSLVKEKFRSAEPTEDMEQALWVELKRLYEPDKEDALWNEVPNESLPDSSSAQPSEVPFEQHPSPSPRPSPRPLPTPIVTGENLGDHSSNDTSHSGNEDDMTLQNVYDLCISLCQ